jgi:DNA (cytosine-5)-methyltransferase 1
MRTEIIEIGNIVGERARWESPMRGRIYSALGLSPAMNCCEGGQLQPKVILLYED